MPTDYPPPGLGYLAATLRAAGKPVRILDASTFSWRRLGSALRDAAPDIVGLTVWSVDRAQAFRAARLARAVVPKTRIVVGGHHATALPHHMFAKADADFVVVGPGEDTFLALIERLEQGGDLFDDIPGLVYRGTDGLRATGPGRVQPDIDRIPFPRHEDTDLRSYNGLPEVKGCSAAIITSRGCPYDCTFCGSSSFWKRRWFYRSADNVIEEIDYLVSSFGIRGLYVYDDNFVLRKDRVARICEGIRRRGWKLQWVAEASARNVDRELLQEMHSAGCFRIEFGVESGSGRVLDAIGKPLVPDDVRRAFALCHEVGIRPRALLMVGNPGETEATIDETVALMGEVEPYYTVGGQIAWVLPGTALCAQAEQAGQLNERFWLENDSMPYFTVEHSERELLALRGRLMRGLARNRGTTLAWLEYAFVASYQRSAAVRLTYHKFLARMPGLFRAVHRV